MQPDLSQVFSNKYPQNKNQRNTVLNSRLDRQNEGFRAIISNYIA